MNNLEAFNCISWSSAVNGVMSLMMLHGLGNMSQTGVPSHKNLLKERRSLQVQSQYYSLATALLPEVK